MEMRIRVEELQLEGFAGCYPHKTVLCRSGKLNWTIRNNNECYRCNFFQKAVVNFETDNHKAEKINAIGRWSQNPFWTEACTKEKI
eukprot:14374844-Heterocapsa_arctica.AAC.1